jgi:hypothetical protein
MSIATIIIMVMAFDFGSGYMFRVHKKKKDLLIRLEYTSKIESILSDETKPINERIYRCQHLSRNTEGECAFGVYLALDTIQRHLKK